MTACAHRQAEPVILTTGETVACVCIACFQPIAADWIANQRRRAEREARCTHDDLVELGMFGQQPADWDRLCVECGARNPVRADRIAL